MRWFRTVVLLIIGPACALAPIGTLQAQTDLNETTVLLPARVFDAEAGSMRAGWAVVIKGDRIQAVGPAAELGQSPGAVLIELPGATLLPGLIDAHSHVTLHPYDETPWADQVVRESLEERTIRAVAHAGASLINGFTLLRDLGAEGAGQADVSLRDAIAAGIVPGQRLLVVSRAIVDVGPTAKRSRHRAMGRLFRILKRTSHITIILDEKAERPKEKPSRQARRRAGSRGRK